MLSITPFSENVAGFHAISYNKKRRSPVWETPRAAYAAGKNMLAYAFLCAAFWPASRPKVTLRPAAQPASRFG